MSEKIFYMGDATKGIGEKSKLKNWTSYLKKIFFSHKLITISVLVIVISFSMNFWLVYNFFKIIETM